MGALTIWRPTATAVASKPPVFSPNWIDRAVAYVSPRAGLRRIRSRAAMATIKLAYDGAKTGRRTEGWITSGNSAAAEVGPSLRLTRERARDLVRNNAYAAKAVSEFVEYVVGTGIVPQAKTGNSSLDKQIDELWEQWSSRCDAEEQLTFDGLTRLVCRAEFESGEVLCRFRRRRLSDGLPVPLQLQIQEPDYIDSSKSLGVTSSYIILGIQFNQFGKREGYWLFGNHPGEIVTTSLRGTMQSRLVPASEILHIYRKDRPEQPRGITRLAPIMMALRDLADYEDAELIRKKVEACYAVFIETLPTDDSPAGISATTEEGSGDTIDHLRPGMIKKLAVGQTVKFGSPNAVPGYRDYKATKLQEMATGAGMMYAQLSGDWSEVNFSAGRLGLHSFQAAVSGYYWQLLVPMFLQRVRERFIDAAVASGKLPIPISENGVIESKYYNTDWPDRQFPSPDPLKDAQKNLIEIRTGESTLPQVIAKKGYDPAKQLQEIADTNKILDKLEITLDSDPRKVTKVGAVQSEPAAEKEGDDDD